jgi:hypothetical protein
MNPQQSFSLSDGMHAQHSCFDHAWLQCSTMHLKATHTSHEQCGASMKLSDCLPTYESSYPLTRLGRKGRTCYVGIPATPIPKHSQFRPADKRIQFNRMNGSPGDPPGSCMHTFINERIVPSLTRLVGDPYGKEANRETTIGDTKYVIKHIN